MRSPAGPAAGHRHPDGDGQHRPAFRPRARTGLDRAGPAGRFPAGLRSCALRSTRSMPAAAWCRLAGDGKLIVRHSRRLSRRRQEHGPAGQAILRPPISPSRRRRVPQNGHRRVIGVIENQAPTRALSRRVCQSPDGIVQMDRVRTMSARSRSSSGTAARAPSQRLRFRFRLHRTAPWPRPWPMTATT